MVSLLTISFYGSQQKRTEKKDACQSEKGDACKQTAGMQRCQIFFIVSAIYPLDVLLMFTSEHYDSIFSE
jgi:hypothetical protein